MRFISLNKKYSEIWWEASRYFRNSEIAANPAGALALCGQQRDPDLPGEAQHLKLDMMRPSKAYEEGPGSRIGPGELSVR